MLTVLSHNGDRRIHDARDTRQSFSEVWRFQQRRGLHCAHSALLENRFEFLLWLRAPGLLVGFLPSFKTNLTGFRFLLALDAGLQVPFQPSLKLGCRHLNEPGSTVLVFS